MRTDGVSTLGGVAVGVAAGTDASLGEDIAGGAKKMGQRYFFYRSAKQFTPFIDLRKQAGR